MVRTQIQLTESQSSKLKAMASSRNLPVAELIRASIDSFIEREAGTGRAALVARAKAAAGRFCSDSPNGSARHDAHLADAFRSSR